MPRVTFYRDSSALCPNCQAVWLLLAFWLEKYGCFLFVEILKHARSWRDPVFLNLFEISKYRQMDNNPDNQLVSLHHVFPGFIFLASLNSGGKGDRLRGGQRRLTCIWSEV